MFTLKIELGNAAMQSGRDVAGALEDVAQKLRDGHKDGNIRDVNGNKVGTWSLEGDSEEE